MANRQHKTSFRGALISVDRTGLARLERKDPVLRVKYMKEDYSHKIKSAASRVQVVVGVTSGRIHGVTRAEPAGANPDISQFRRLVLPQLIDGERVVTDAGYTSQQLPTITPAVSKTFFASDKRYFQEISARHEAVNRRLKSWRVLGDRFRTTFGRHTLCVKAVAQLVSLDMINGHSMWPTF